MPSTWRKAKISGFSRFIANLRNRRGVGDHPSSLVVQPGFPTSLADLYVKNSGRLRKSSPSRSAQPSSASTSTSASASASTPAPSRAPSSVYTSFGKRKPPPPPARPPSPTKQPFLASPSDSIGSELHGSEEPREAAGSDGANEERIDLSAASPNREISSSHAASPNREVPAPSGVASRAGAREEKSSISDAEVIRPNNNACPARLGFQAKIVLILILAVCTRDVVVGMMVSATLLLFFEAVGCRLFNWWRSGKDGKGNAATNGNSARDPGVSEAAVGGSLSSRLDQSAPRIRSSVSLSSRLDGSWDFSGFKLDELSASPLTGSERDDEYAAAGTKGVVSDGEAESTNMKKKKKKKFWSKVVKEKFRNKCRKRKKDPSYAFNSESLPEAMDMDKGEICADTGEISAGSLDSSDTDDIEEDDSCEDGSGMDQGEILPSENLNQSTGTGISMLADTGTVTKAKSIGLVLMAVVLSGLIGGRFLALALTVITCYLLKLSGALRRLKTQ